MTTIKCDGCECEQNNETGSFKKIKSNNSLRHYCSDCFKWIKNQIDFVQNEKGTK